MLDRARHNRWGSARRHLYRHAFRPGSGTLRVQIRGDLETLGSFARSDGTYLPAPAELISVNPGTPYFVTIDHLYRTSEEQAMKRLSILLAGLLLAQVTFAGTRSAEGTVRDTTRAVLEQLNENRARLKSEPEYIEQLVRKLIVPHFDFALMAQLVMGPWWEKFDLPQRTCFIDGFRNLLVERYAYILLSYDNQHITYDAAEEIGREGLQRVRQTISREGAEPLPIEYAMEKMNGDWMVADLIIDGISLVRSHRGMFQSRIHTQGRDYFLKTFPNCRTR
uniref:ABC transporter substrate-binding protein n=1 Tax=uncultured organism TaxID=155900 RepID=A0A8F3C5L6_9ZZZZ|nr:hypothetical protein [uncultured organism]